MGRCHLGLPQPHVATIGVGGDGAGWEGLGKAVAGRGPVPNRASGHLWQSAINKRAVEVLTWDI